MKRIFVLLIGILCLVQSCQQDQPPGVPEPVMPSITNDFMAALAGVQAAISVAGLPTSPAQAACYALWGTWTGLSASGYFGQQKESWPTSSYSLNIDSINQVALSTYTVGETDFAGLGEIHNAVLHLWAASSPTSSFGNNTTTHEFIENYFDTSTVVARYVCEARISGRALDLTDSLTYKGVMSVKLDLEDQEDLEDYFEDMSNLFPAFEDALDLMYQIGETAWELHENRQYTNLYNYLKLEVRRINSNYYNLDATNYAAAIVMANIFVYSYHYWKAYYSKYN